MVRSTELIPVIRTDHDAILLEIGKLENGQKGPGYWKLNCSLLADDAYVNSVTDLLSGLQTGTFRHSTEVSGIGLNNI